MTETQQIGPDPKYLAKLPEIGELLHNVLIKYLIEGGFPENNTQDFYLNIFDTFFYNAIYGIMKINKDFFSN